MAEHGSVWNDEEIHLLLALWSNDTVQHELLGAYRKESCLAEVGRSWPMS